MVRGRKDTELFRQAEKKFRQIFLSTIDSVLQHDDLKVAVVVPEMYIFRLHLIHAQTAPWHI